jgi:type I restriction enzyme S subunit
MKTNSNKKNIPHDWEDITLGECFENIGGTALEEYIAEIGNYNFISIGNYSIDGKYIDNGQRIVLNAKTSEKILSKGDLVMVLNDKTTSGALIGSTILIEEDNKYIYNQRSERLIPNKNIKSSYAWYLLNSDFRKQIFAISQGGTQIYVNFPSVKKLKLRLPSLLEQNRIVAVLMAWDKGIEKLQKKIELKEKIKKGLIQDLLTGKKRLSGFSKEWEFVRLGAIANMNSGGTPKSSNESFYGGDIPWVSIADMTASGKYIYKTMKNLTKNGLANSAAKIYPKGAILYAMYASIGECSIAAVNMASSQAILGIIPHEEKLYSMFLYFYLCFIKEKIKLQGQKGTQSNLNAGMVRDFKFLLPSIKEQVAITNVLSKADDEITQLEHKLLLIKDQKNYLLNNLITGKIRTPETLLIKN